jgi:hypothetical protein
MPGVRAAIVFNSTCGSELHAPRVDVENGLAPLQIGVIHDDLAVEPSRAQQRRVERLRREGTPIARRNTVTELITRQRGRRHDLLFQSASYEG